MTGLRMQRHQSKDPIIKLREEIILDVSEDELDVSEVLWNMFDKYDYKHELIHISTHDLNIEKWAPQG